MRALRYARSGAYAACATVALLLAYLSREQFLVWQKNEITKYLLPPYHSIGYFFGYVGGRLWAPYAFSAIAAAAAYCVAVRINRKRGGVFFETEEPQYLAIGIFMTGHPGWVAYIVVTLGAYLAVSTVRFALFRQQERISFYRFWLPCAAATVALETVLTRYDWYASLFF